MQSEHELLGQANDADDSFVIVDLLTSTVQKPIQGVQAELLDITIVPRDTAFGRLAEILSSGPGPAGRLSTFSVFHSTSTFYGAFVWARRVLNNQKMAVFGPPGQWSASAKC